MSRFVPAQGPPKGPARPVAGRRMSRKVMVCPTLSMVYAMVVATIPLHVWGWNARMMCAGVRTRSMSARDRARKSTHPHRVWV